MKKILGFDLILQDMELSPKILMYITLILHTHIIYSNYPTSVLEKYIIGCFQDGVFDMWDTHENLTHGNRMTEFKALPDCAKGAEWDQLLKHSKQAFLKCKALFKSAYKTE